MKKILSIMLLAILLMTMVTLPISAETVGPTEIAAQRDDVLIVFDGTMVENYFQKQWDAGPSIKLEEASDLYVQGKESLFIDMPEDDLDLQFPYACFTLMLILTFEEPFSVQDFPLSEFSVYNHQEVESGYASDYQLQINYVDPDNGQWNDDSYNMDFSVAGYEPGWHLLQHNVMKDSIQLPSNPNPDNIARMRIAIKIQADEKGNIVYSENDWNFDCMLVAKQSFFDDRATAEAEMIGIIDSLASPTVENYETVRGEIEAAMEKRNAYLEEFPNFMVLHEDKMIKLNELWDACKAIRAQEAAATIIEKISELGEITPENYPAKLIAIETIETEIKTYTASGYNQNLITNRDVLDVAKASCRRFDVERLLDALPTLDALTPEDETKITAAKTALEALAADQQALIAPEKKDQIPALLAKLEELKNPYTLGMVNDDDTINASDALLALQHSVKLITLEDNAFKAADVSGDGTVDASDALLILQCSVKLITPDDFPAAKK